MVGTARRSRGGEGARSGRTDPPVIRAAAAGDLDAAPDVVACPSAARLAVSPAVPRRRRAAEDVTQNVPRPSATCRRSRSIQVHDLDLPDRPQCGRRRRAADAPGGENTNGSREPAPPPKAEPARTRSALAIGVLERPPRASRFSSSSCSGSATGSGLVLGVAEGTVKSRVFQARKELAGSISDTARAEPRRRAHNDDV